MIFDWDARLFDRKRTLFSINGVGKTEYLYTKKRNWPFTIYIKINSKSIKDLNVSAKTIKTLRRKSGISSQLGIWQWFLAYDTKSKNRQMELHQDENFLCFKGYYQQNERKICKSYIC